MATVTGLTAARMAAIEAASVVSGVVTGDDLILKKYDNTTINAGNVRGPQGIQGVPGDVSNAGLRRGAFSVTTGRTAGQTVGTGAWTQIILGAEEWNVDTWFNIANYRYVPQVAGYYRFNAHVGWASAMTQYTYITLGLFKNGAHAKRLDGYEVARTQNGMSLSGSAVLFLNGTTDYVQPHVYHNDAASRDIAPGVADTFLQGELIAPSV